uniref:LAC REPRESSOR HP62/DNA COMPLEX REGULATION, LAC OPERON, LAC n=1 Tax=Siphoviridae sp. ctxMM9 TaxID=2827973 RepID=A0A8S5T803_9CAUD|nr:MAG TPA: LAC REPRESSOR HP62/DNA COMPLEX REGULATION, LAC OPERON, LAC [Siphoviridae sp. ctxMM9]
MLKKELTQKEIGKQFGVNEDVIGAIKNKHNWKYLTNNINFN